MASSKRSSSLPRLPLELVEEILYRTPVESLIRFKPTCKQWNALISDKRFMYNHLRRSPERFIRKVDTVQIMDPVTGTRSDSPIPNEIDRDDTFLIHCDGIMLCVCINWLYGSERKPNLAIWNPVLRKMRWIEPSRFITSFDSYGIGYDKNQSRDGYKILRFTEVPLDDDEGCEDEPQVEIYEFKTNSWRNLDAIVGGSEGQRAVEEVNHIGVSVMGNMYWLCNKMDKNYILGFDFSVETFEDICFCPPSYDNYDLGCFNGDRLSLLKQDQASRQIDLWVSSKLADGNVSFSKYFSVSHPDRPSLRFDRDTTYPVYCFVKPKSIIAWCEELVDERGKFFNCFTLYEIDEGGIRKALVTERDYEHAYRRSLVCGYLYVPSLIPLPGEEV